MRFTEFNTIKEAAPQQDGYFTVGDSTAANLAATGKPWISRAQPGTLASNPVHKKTIDSIPAGSVVAISLGADDAQTSSTPQEIVNNVSSTVDYAKEKGLWVVFVLFPSTASQATDRNTQIRSMLRAHVKAPILDMETNGQIAEYSTISSQILSKFQPSSQLMARRAAGTQAGVAAPATTSATSGKVGKILDLISRYESRGNYNIILGGSTRPLTSMTIAQVYDLQRQMIRSGKESSAVGRYQYVRKTLKWMVDMMGLDPTRTKFDERTQDAIAIYDLRKRCNLDDWLAGRISDKVFLSKISKVWASIPNPSTGKSAYAGVGSNVAGTSTSAALGTLQNIRVA